jgi:hypothetical protein
LSIKLAVKLKRRTQGKFVNKKETVPDLMMGLPPFLGWDYETKTLKFLRIPGTLLKIIIFHKPAPDVPKNLRIRSEKI